MNTIVDNNLYTDGKVSNNDSLIIDVQLLKKHVTCPICLEYFIKPITLDCQHSFCYDCISKSLVNKHNCPLCSHIISKNWNILSCKEIQLDDLISSIKLLINSIDNEDLSQQTNYINNNYNHQKFGNKKVLTSIDNNSPPNNNLDNNYKNDNKHQENIENFDNNKLENNIYSYIENNTTEIKEFAIGEVVNVVPRTWIGINKPGGAAWIKAKDGEDTYTVKYILGGGCDTKVPCIFIEKSSSLDRSTRRSRTSLSPIKSIVHEDIIEPNKSKRQTRKPLAELNANHFNQIHNQIDNLNIKSNKRSRIDTEVNNNKKYVILTSSIPSDVTINLELLEKTFSNLRITNRFDDTVTHLIVSPDSKGILYNRTMKYLQAIINGVWILTTDWIYDCLKSNKLLNENKYELKYHSKSIRDCIPKIARETNYLINKNKHHKLFKDVAVCLYGSFPNPGPPKSDIRYLLDNGGALIESNLPHLIDHTDRYIKVVICADVNIIEEASSIISNLNKNHNSNIRIINSIWVLDCITNYDICDRNSIEYSII